MCIYVCDPLDLRVKKLSIIVLIIDARCTSNKLIVLYTAIICRMTTIEYCLHRKTLQYAIVLCCIIAVTSDTPSPLITLPYSRILIVAHFHAASFNPIFSSTLSPNALNELKINWIHLDFQQSLTNFKGPVSRRELCLSSGRTNYYLGPTQKLILCKTL